MFGLVLEFLMTTYSKKGRLRLTSMV